MLQKPKKAVNDVNGLKQCLAEFKRDLEWVERLHVTLGPVPEVNETQPTPENKDQKKDVNPEDDFQREMSFYRQAQAAVLSITPAPSAPSPHQAAHRLFCRNGQVRSADAKDSTDAPDLAGCHGEM